MEEVPHRANDQKLTIRRQSDPDQQRRPTQPENQRLVLQWQIERAELADWELKQFQLAALKQRSAEATAQWVAAAQRVGRLSANSANEGAAPGRDLYDRQQLQEHLFEVAERRAAERELGRRPPEFPIFTSGAPDPSRAGTPAEFVALMRDLYDWSGLTLRELEERAGPGGLPKSTLCDALKRDRLPRLELLTAFTAAAGLPMAERIGWDLAWHKLKRRNWRPRPATMDHVAAAAPATTQAAEMVVVEPLPQKQRRRLFRRDR